MNIIEKNLAKKANLDTVIPRERITIEPSGLIILGEEAAHVINSFNEFGYKNVLFPSRVIFIGDAKAEKESTKTAKHFCKVHDLAYVENQNQFIDQFVCDKKPILNKLVIAGGDSYIGALGAYGCISILASSASIAQCLSTGKLHALVPESIFIEMNGDVSQDAGADSICSYLQDFFGDSLVGCGIMIGGSAIQQLDDVRKRSIVRFLYEIGANICMVSPQGPMGQVESVIRVNARDIPACS